MIIKKDRHYPYQDVEDWLIHRTNEREARAMGHKDFPELPPEEARIFNTAAWSLGVITVAWVAFLGFVAFIAWEILHGQR